MCNIFGVWALWCHFLYNFQQEYTPACCRFQLPSGALTVLSSYHLNQLTSTGLENPTGSGIELSLPRRTKVYFIFGIGGPGKS